MNIASLSDPAPCLKEAGWGGRWKSGPRARKVVAYGPEEKPRHQTRQETVMRMLGGCRPRRAR